MLRLFVAVLVTIAIGSLVMAAPLSGKLMVGAMLLIAINQTWSLAERVVNLRA